MKEKDCYHLTDPMSKKCDLKIKQCHCYINDDDSIFMFSVDGINYKIPTEYDKFFDDSFKADKFLHLRLNEKFTELEQTIRPVTDALNYISDFCGYGLEIGRSGILEDLQKEYKDSIERIAKGMFGGEGYEVTVASKMRRLK